MSDERLSRVVGVVLVRFRGVSEIPVSTISELCSYGGGGSHTSQRPTALSRVIGTIASADDSRRRWRHLNRSWVGSERSF